jgi:MATE family multidrug resistance protein
MLNKIIAKPFAKELKSTFNLSTPLIAAQLIYACSGFIATVLIAPLGEEALAASVLVSTIWWCLLVLFFGILNAGSVLIAHHFGAKNWRGISEVMGQSYVLGFIACLAIFLVLQSMPFFLAWTHQPPHVLHLAIQYVNALAWTIPGLIFLVLTEQFLAGIGLGKIVMRISILVVPIEIFIIDILITGKFGVPAFGIAGIGYGFAITYTLATFGLITYLHYSAYYKKFAIFSRIGSCNLIGLSEFILLGLPMGFMGLIEVSTFAIITFWMARLGTTLLAAHQVVMQYANLAITIVFGMAQAVTVRVGHAVGRKDILGIRHAIYAGIFISFCIIAAIVLFFDTYPKLFINVDIPNTIANAKLLKHATDLFFIMGCLIIFDNFRIIGFGALRGLKDTSFSMYASLVGFWLVGLCSAYVLGFVSHWQGAGIWWGLTLGIGSSAIMVMWRLYYLLARMDKLGLAILVTQPAKFYD